MKIRMFLSYAVGSTVEKIRVERDTQTEALQEILTILYNVRSQGDVQFMITNYPVVRLDAYILME